MESLWPEAVMSLIERVTTSWNGAQVALTTRELAGTQPELPLTSWPAMVNFNVAYLVVTALLYQWMQQRAAPFQLRPVMMVYNAICVGLAGAVVYGIVAHKLQSPGTFACNKGDGTTPADHRLAWYFWLFYIQKYWEFCDTWIFLLRKSFRQVTLLHLYHHASIAVVVGVILPYSYAGDMYLPILLNSFVHVLMYSHYFVTTLGYKAWWAPFLTMLQLAQFVLIASQSWIALRSGASCGSPDFVKVLLIGYMVTMVYLFSRFFVGRYLKPAKTDKNSKNTGGRAVKSD